MCSSARMSETQPEPESLTATQLVPASKTWSLSSDKKPDDDMEAPEFCEIYARGLRNPALGDTLILNVCSTFGAFSCKQFRAIPRQSVVEAVVEAKLNAAIVDSIESKLFSPGKGFRGEAVKDSESGEPDDGASRPQKGGYQKLKFTGLQEEEVSVNSMLGGAVATQSLQFPSRMMPLLRAHLCQKDKPDCSAVTTLVFQFWIVAFHSVYLDITTKTKVSYLLHAINTTIDEQTWGTKLQIAFNNKRQGRFTRQLKFHPSDAPTELIDALKMLD